MGYVRIGDYLKQQQTAMALFKVKPKNPYYFWAVMSILMQVKHIYSKVFLQILIHMIPSLRPIQLTILFAALLHYR